MHRKTSPPPLLLTTTLPDAKCLTQIAIPWSMTLACAANLLGAFLCRNEVPSPFPLPPAMSHTRRACTQVRLSKDATLQVRGGGEGCMGQRLHVHWGRARQLAPRSGSGVTQRMLTHSCAGCTRRRLGVGGGLGAIMQSVLHCDPGPRPLTVPPSPSPCMAWPGEGTPHDCRRPPHLHITRCCGCG